MAKLSKELRMGIHNRFDIEVVDAETGEVKQKAQAFNVVCDGYWTYTLAERRVFDTVAIGTGAGTPSASDTTLFNYIGNSTYDINLYNSYDVIDASNEHLGIWCRTFKSTIPNASYVGANITEIGLGDSTYLLTHAMLKDMNGNTISITKTDTDIINIYCSLYLHYSGQNSDIHVYFARVKYSYSGGQLIDYILGRRHSTNSSDNRLGLYPTTLDCGNTVLNEFINTTNNTGAVSYAYGTNPPTITLTAQQIPVSKGNMNGINELMFRYGDNWNSYHDFTWYSIIVESGGTIFPPHHVTGESVGTGDGTTVKFKTTFDCPYNARIYVNGVLQNNGVTVKKYPQKAQPQTIHEGYGYFINEVHPKNVHLKYKNRMDSSSYTDYSYIQKTGLCYENIGNDLFGISQIRFNSQNGNAYIFNVQGSNDGLTWDDIGSGGYSSSNSQIWTSSAASANYRYYKINFPESASIGCP